MKIKDLITYYNQIISRNKDSIILDKMKNILSFTKKLSSVPNYIMIDPYTPLSSAEHNLQFCEKMSSIGSSSYDYLLIPYFDRVYDEVDINNIKFINIHNSMVGIGFKTHKTYGRLLFKINDRIQYPPIEKDMWGNFLYLPGKNHPIKFAGNNSYCSTMRYYKEYIYDDSIILLIDRGFMINKTLDKFIFFENDKWIINLLQGSCSYIKGNDIKAIINQIELKKQLYYHINSNSRIELDALNCRLYTYSPKKSKKRPRT